jgi:hypothetical protein
VASLPVVLKTLRAGQMYTLRCVSKLKSSRLKVPSSRWDLSLTGICGAILASVAVRSALC